MRFRIKKCTNCGLYTLDERCRLCGSETASAHPAPFSPDDKYALLKVQWEEDETEKG